MSVFSVSVCVLGGFPVVSGCASDEAFITCHYVGNLLSPAEACVCLLRRCHSVCAAQFVVEEAGTAV